MSKVKNWRNAATLMIASRISRTAAIDSTKLSGEDYRVLFLKRSSKSSFMPNKCVFPGGVISTADFSPKWLDLFSDHGVPSSSINKLIGVSNPCPKLYAVSSQPDCLAPELAYRLCALRETFEESGLLISKSEIQNEQTSRSPISSIKHLKSKDEINKWRKYVMDDPSMFLELFREYNCVPDIWALHEWSNWLTPEFVSKRFDTLFYICLLEDEAHVMEDGMEIVESTWLSPSECLQQHLLDNIMLAPPQMYEMCRMTNDKTWSGLSSFVQDREKMGVLRYEAVNKITDDGEGFAMYLPGDELFKHHEELRKLPDKIIGDTKNSSEKNIHRYISTPTEKSLICRLSICGHRTFEFKNKIEPNTSKL